MRRALALSFVLFGGCYWGDGTPADPATMVGSAPLRRLTDEELDNALHDLFGPLASPLPRMPSDATVAGFDNAAEAQQPSDVRIARYESIATAYGQAATADIATTRMIVGCDDWSTAALADACGRRFVERWGTRLFRRPLTADELVRFDTRFATWRAASDFEGAVQLTLGAMLQSPQFLYRPEPTAATHETAPVEPFAMATRLSFFLWESVPDDVLLRAAAADELRTESQLRAQAARMLSDDRAKRVYWSFHRQWLGLDRVLLDEHAARAGGVDPAWTATTQTSALLESKLFVENVLGQGGTLVDLFTSRRAWIDPEMGRIYGISATPGSNEVTLPEGERAGLLTRVAFLAGYSHRGATSPPVRGNFIQLRMLCELPMAPPPGVDLSPPMADPTQGPQTNRMLFEARTRPATCQGCHSGLNGFGFGLENYDAAGHHQTTDHGLGIDAHGHISGTDVDGPFDGAIELSNALARSRIVRRCAAERWFRFALGRAPEGVEASTLNALSTAFDESSGDVRALLTEIVASPTFRLRKAAP